MMLRTNFIPLDQLQTVSAALHLSTIVEILTVVFESAAVLKLPARIASLQLGLFAVHAGMKFIGAGAAAVQRLPSAKSCPWPLISSNCFQPTLPLVLQSSRRF
jgi:hypothetical protein